MRLSQQGRQMFNKKNQKNFRSSIICDCDRNGMILSIQNAREDNKDILPFMPLLPFLALCFIFVFTTGILKSFYYHNISAAGGAIVLGVIVFGVLFVFLHIFHGKKTVILSQKKLHIIWHIYIPIRKHSIGLVDVCSFKINTRSSASHGEWYALSADTADGEFSLFESRDLLFLSEWEGKLNSTLKHLRNLRDGDLNKKGEHCVTQQSFCKNCEMNHRQKCPMPSLVCDNREHDQVVFCRHGSINVYSLALFVLCDLFVAGFLIMHINGFVSGLHFPSKIVLPVTSFLTLWITLIIIVMLGSNHYREKWIFEKKRILRVKQFLFFKHKITISAEMIDKIQVVQEDTLSSILFGDKLIAPLFNKIKTWQVQLSHKNILPLISLKSMSKCESDELSSILCDFYINPQ